ncbi:o-succinylbenzoate--CoA ligase [Vibrio sp.]|uniref:o-succinylbenzoate--CoA ligase n=1 Tax=Vibrio sp. TaxID=678 RepID=UPI003D09D13D
MITTERPLWQHWARVRPDAVALRCEGQRLTWQEIEQQVSRLAAQLAAQGVTQGSVVALLGKNHHEMVLLYLASAQLGALTALLMPQPQAALEQKLATLTTPGQQHFIYWRQPDHSSPALPAGWRTLDISGQSNAEVHHTDAFSPENLASVIFTSGSSGNPKAVVHRHCQHYASAEGLLASFGFDSQDCWLLSLPIYHVSGLAIVYRWLIAGACLQVGSGDLASDIQDVSHASLVATQLKKLLDSKQSLSLTHVLLGGGHIPISLANQAAEQGIATWLGYGLTEAASTVTAKPVDEQPGAGQLLAGRKLKLIGDRIYIGGDTLAAGYYRQGKVIPLSLDGWFDSKDLGRWHGDDLQILGRADNQFISGGENIHCEEIEAALLRHPRVDQAMVIAVEDDQYGARPVALIASQEGINSHELSEFLLDKLEKFKHPDHYLAMPALADSGGIKLSRSRLKQWLSRHSDFTVI